MNFLMFGFDGLYPVTMTEGVILADLTVSSSKSDFLNFFTLLVVCFSCSFCIDAIGKQLQYKGVYLTMHNVDPLF